MSSSKKLYSQKDIADKLGIDKNKVYRYIKSHHIKEHSQSGAKLLYSEQQQTAIVKGLQPDTDPLESTQTSTLVDTLRTEVEQKNSEIAQLHKEIDQLHNLLDQQQRLNLSNQRLLEQGNTTPQEKTPEQPEKGTEPQETPKKSLWQRILKK